MDERSALWRHVTELEDLAIRREAELAELRLRLKTAGADRGSAEDLPGLDQARAQLEAQLETSPSGILVVGLEARVVAYNQRFLELLEIPPEVAATGADDRLLENVRTRIKDWPVFLTLVEEIYAQPELERRGDLIEMVSGRVLSRNTQPVRLSDGAVIGRVWDFTDVTELHAARTESQRLQAQMLQAQKLESLGLLAGGIAHDFNNLLGGVLGNAGLALMQLAANDPARPYVEEVEHAAERAAGLAEQMLTYSGKGQMVVRALDLNGLVTDMVGLLEVSISKKGRLDLDLVEPSPTFEGEATQIRQVLMNLITNAADALGEEEGSVSIRTGVLDADRAYLSRSVLDEELPSGCYVFFEVKDTGCGMDEATRAKIFDPFFTTKDEGRGLGMAAVLGIVRNHLGAIFLDSTPGVGSTFRVLLPACDPPSSGPLPESAEQAPAQAGGTVLVVDDEVLIRMVAEGALTAAGFDVLLAEDGRRGVDLFERHGEGIAVVLLDMSMPGLDGLEVYHELRRITPGVRVVFSSGYSEESEIHRVAMGAPVRFLKKPYRPHELVRKVCSLLDP